MINYGKLKIYAWLEYGPSSEISLILILLTKIKKNNMCRRVLVLHIRASEKSLWQVRLWQFIIIYLDWIFKKRCKVGSAWATLEIEPCSDQVSSRPGILLLKKDCDLWSFTLSYHDRIKRYSAFGEERKALSKRYECGINRHTIAVKRCRWLRRGARWRWAGSQGYARESPPRASPTQCRFAHSDSQSERPKPRH